MYLLRTRSRSTASRRARVSANQFLVGFALVAVTVAGLLSYLAGSAPDGLDATTQRGCTVSEVGGVEQLDGTCIAQQANQHHPVNSPLAGYTVDGNGALTGVAGVLGVAAAFAILVALVRAIGARRRPAPTSDGTARSLAGRTP
ncbi:PDGLE domain-containing protein [Aldersonia sp. NBC_00410]|uniref:PDGLE domain-containing protein n=1 Tax=Aldersonia sp. NBC_00410 TaxID=2975954 RepID=UPI002252E5A9|nr:PDGLE domain-containing protein [Aldersonia sp. NBC_00410]MCX5045195.1 PDGLE domain-containing protein [Aldersonia sp. NBC_00410]